MADPFVGELRLVAFNFAPKYWATANGQIMAIQTNAALFSLLGINFGGNGTSNFGLPNLQGGIPVGAGQGTGLSAYNVGETGGSQAVTLEQTQMPTHYHTVNADNEPASSNNPAGSALARIGSLGNLYTTSTSPKVQMNAGIVSPYGENLPHNNMMPYLTLNWIISLSGVFPPRN